MEGVQKYWMVHKLANGGNASQVKHQSKSAAIIEAKRLAKSNPGVTFTVLEVVDAYCTMENPVQQVNVFGDETNGT